MIEYMYWRSLKNPATYDDNRLDVFNVGSIFPWLCHFAPTPLININISLVVNTHVSARFLC